MNVPRSQDMLSKPFSSLLPPPKHVDTEKKSLTVNGSNKSKKDTVILDSLRPENLPVASISDFVPLRQRDLSLEIPLPTVDEIKRTYNRTKVVLDKLIRKKLNPQLVKTTASHNNSREEVISSLNSSSGKREVKIIEHRKDPLQPVTHRKRKVVAPNEEIQAPILHKTDDSTTKPTKEDVDKWRIPSAISNWKNPKGFAISLENRVTIESKGDEQASTANEKLLQLSEALDEAEKQARENINLKQEAKKELEEQELLRKEQLLQNLAERARQSHREDHRRQYENEDHYIRERERSERIRAKRDEERSSRMSTAEKLRRLAHQQGRDVSEKVVLNAAKATKVSDVQYDSRLFTKAATSSVSSTHQTYDSPLFSATQIDNIYRPPAGSNEETSDIVDRITNKRGRTGPVEFSSADDSKAPEAEADDEEQIKEYGLHLRKKPHNN
ncbi:pre-mRNA-processing protein 45 [Kluyveromyces marxianus]|uniref:Pre-mRNA-processing protein 45 n=1 Tax=Kluyveromyces marxianus (strain DMKU3-1042 / BCC 29191 / NBRC 104275) TaxID=1003335 RepID=W0TBF2_KLUMD|nr:pre-mRNA-processing protein 45 [Kluyveromyces marxianus DMKU3-1042]BAO40760.1 pre-mRNA-processing protein 45 [Kluyveromyces marxianus DMKU3-1042]BAP72233.1 pre-mRNA-processing protein 45 [Kluyveromyces marxianus]